MIPDHAVSVDLQVSFNHCDPLFVVWHGRYFEYLEVARLELFRSFDLDIPVFRALDLRMYITDLRCRYMAPLTYGDQVRVTAWLKDQGPLLRVVYDVKNLTSGRRAARAYTCLATTDAEGNLLTEVPDAIQQRLPSSVT